MKLKMKLIFNTVDRLSQAARSRTANPVVLRRSLSTLIVALVFILTVPASAQQQPDQSQPQPPSAAPAAPATLSDPPPDDATQSMFPHFKDTRFWVSGQSNFIFQTHPGFHASYSGEHSLSPHYEKATSRVLTLYTGMRLNNSTEILVDVEEAGGRRRTPVGCGSSSRLWSLL